MNKILTVIVSFLPLILSACTLPLNADLINALAKDNASFCAAADLHGGAGGGTIAPVPVVPMAGYGSATLVFCRTNERGSSLSMKPDGTMAIEHGNDSVGKPVVQ